jgi:hypothetical protein
MPSRTISQTAKILTGEGGELILRITTKTGSRVQRTVTDHYRLERNPNAPGAWRLHKQVFEGEEPKLYDVCLSGDYPSCDCLGSEDEGNCKHRKALQALYDAGKLNDNGATS